MKTRLLRAIFLIGSVIGSAIVAAVLIIMNQPQQTEAPAISEPISAEPALAEPVSEKLAEPVLEKPTALPGEVEPSPPKPSSPEPSPPAPVSLPPVLTAPVSEKPAEAVSTVEPEILINEDLILPAVVRLRCGRSFGSGFVVKSPQNKSYVLTAAHVVIDQIDSDQSNCDIIFPMKDHNFGYYREAHYRKGKILLPEETEKNYKEKGQDIAALAILPLEDSSEDARVFPGGYPTLAFPFCPTDTLKDKIILWGYSVNVGTSATAGGLISRFDGELIQYGDIVGIERKQSSSFISGYEYLPLLEYNLDESREHSFAVIVSKNNFSGASGGLVLDINKSCIAGVNIATAVGGDAVLGLIINPNFSSIQSWLELVFAKL